MAATDRRIKKTKRAILHAFATLMQEKRFDDITVNDICDQAEISRTTFYHYYIDKYDWLEKVVYDTVIEDFSHVGDPKTRSPEIVIGMLTTAFQNVKRNVSFYAVILKKENSQLFRERIYNSLITHFEQKAGSESTPTHEQQMAARFIASATVSIIEWWIYSNFALSPEQLAELAYTIRFGVAL